MLRAKGPCINLQPEGLFTRKEANSRKTAWKCPPRRPRWFIARGMKRLVEEEEIGAVEFESFVNFINSALWFTKSELFAWEDKHDLVMAEEMTMSMTVSFWWMPLPSA